MNTEQGIELCKHYIKKYVDNAKAKGVVLGISGGLDSAVTASLAAEALGAQNVWGLILPYKKSATQSILDAEKIIAQCGIKHQTIDITPQIEAYFPDENNISVIRIGNKLARERMAILYDFAQEHQLLVVGTSNKSEWLLGYFTLWGDMAAAFEPLGDLYKTQVIKWAHALNIPESIINKKPSADLWTDQTDEDEIGASYAQLDPILYLYTEKSQTEGDLIKQGYDEQLIQKIIGMLRKTEFKRRMPDILLLQNVLNPLF